MRKLISEPAFLVLVVAPLVGLASLATGARQAVVLCAAATACAIGALVIGWFTKPEPEVPESCPDCLGFIWLPAGDRSIEECQTCRDHPGLAS